MNPKTAPCGELRRSVVDRRITDRRAWSADGGSRLGKSWPGRFGSRTRRGFRAALLTAVCVTLGWASLAHAQPAGPLGPDFTSETELPAIVAVFAADASLDEGTDREARITVSRSGSTDAELAVNLRYRTGPADSFAALDSNSDFQVTDRFGVGESDLTLPFRLVDNNVKEPDGWLEVTVEPSSDSSYFVASPSSVRVTVFEDDEPSWSLDVSPQVLREGAVTSTLTLTTGGPTFRDPQTFSLTFDGGTATFGEDFTVARELTLEAGETSVTTILTVSADNVFESNETIRIEAHHDGDQIESASISIEDDDEPSLSLSTSPSQVGEAAGARELTVKVDTGGVAFAEDREIELAFSGSATKGADYTVGAESLTLTAGQTSVETTVTVVDDNEVDPNETIEIEASIDYLFFLNTPESIGSAQITIVDDDELSWSIEASPSSIAENGGSATITVRTGGVVLAEEVAFSLNIGRSTAARDADFTIPGSFPDLPVGQTSVSITVTAVDDELVEGSETINITVRVESDVLGSAEVVIVDDDGPSWVVTAAPSEIAEAGGTSTVTISTGGFEFADHQTIDLAFSGLATKGTDYTVGAESLTLIAGQTSVSTTVTGVDDNVVDPDESIQVSASVDGERIGSAEVVIADDDEPSWSIEVSPSSIAEDGGSSTITVRTGGVVFDGGVRVVVGQSGGTATTDRDYLIGSQLLNLAAGQSSTSTTVTAVDDALVEGSETIELDAHVDGETYGPVEVEIVDDDDGPSFSLYTSPSQVGEAAGATNLTVTATNDGAALTAPVSISLSVNAGTATATADYSANEAILTIQAGEFTGTAVVTLTPVNDSVVEPDETVTVVGRVRDGYTVNGAPVTILDDDGEDSVLPVISVAAVQEEVEEADGAAYEFRFSRTGSTEAALTVDAVLESRRAPDSPGHVLSRTVTFAEGEAEVLLAVHIGDDNLDEGDSYRVVTIGESPEAWTVSPSAGSATIKVLDNDEIQLSVSIDRTGVEEGEPFILTFGSTNGVVSPNLTILSLSAQDASSGEAGLTASSHDYQVPEELLLQAGTESVSVEIATVEDTLIERNETFRVRAEFRSVVESFDLTIRDDDAPHESGLPYVTVEALTDVVSFNLGTGVPLDVAEFRVSRTGSTAKALRVKLGYVELGLVGDDASFVTLRAGASEMVYKHIVADTDDSKPPQPLPTITFQVEPHDGYVVGEPGRAVVQVGTSMREAGKTGPADSTEELSAGFDQLPAAHGGYGDFTFRLAFSEPVARSFRVLRAALQAEAGEVMGASRVNGRSDLWQITVRAWSRHAVTVSLFPGSSCDDPNAVCTADGRLLANAPVARIPGPPGLSVSDGQATEGEDAAVRFLVTLGRPSTGTVTVGYRTSNGTATAGEDYEASSGTITLLPGATEHAIEVPVLDDGKDDGEETFALALSNASGAWLKDAQAVGTIVNSDPLPKAWLSRFGRTAASHIVDAVSERVSEEPAAGSRVVIGGVRPEGVGAISGREESSTRSFQSLGSDYQRRVLAGSSFRWSSPAESETPEEGGSTPGWTAWGRGATTSFGGREDGVRLDGDVVTGTVGVDYARGRTLTGLALSYSDGVGEYRAAGGEGDLRSSLTSVTPYLRVALNDRLDVWGLLGYGQGDLTLRDDGEGRATETGTDTGMRMGAVGLRGSVLSGSAFDLAIRSDAFWVRADSDATVGLRSAAADATRLRVALEGSRSFELEQGGLFQPSLELGLRYDGGDGETGGGLEVGGAVRYSNPTRGLTFGLNARSLLAHEASGFEEWGAGGSVRLDPGASGRGLSLDLRSSVGTASSGVQRLWSERETAALTRNGGLSDTGRLEAELGYGVGVAAGRGLLTPYGIVSAADGVQAYGVGSRFLLGESFSLGLEASRRERESVAPEGTVTLRAQWRLGSGRSGQGGRGTRSAVSTPGS